MKNPAYRKTTPMQTAISIEYHRRLEVYKTSGHAQEIISALNPKKNTLVLLEEIGTRQRSYLSTNRKLYNSFGDEIGTFTIIGTSVSFNILNSNYAIESFYYRLTSFKIIS